jgi:hypothetical protein
MYPTYVLGCVCYALSYNGSVSVCYPRWRVRAGLTEVEDLILFPGYLR